MGEGNLNDLWAYEPHAKAWTRVEAADGAPPSARSFHRATAVGERLYSRWDFKRVFEANCVDIIQPDLSHAGGISECRRIASMAEAYDVAVQIIANALAATWTD